LQVVHRPEEHLRRIYTKPLLLLRPDLHVVWRGEVLPEDCAGLAALATGWVEPEAHPEPPPGDQP
jgi:hypothetical protein